MYVRTGCTADRIALVELAGELDMYSAQEARSAVQSAFDTDQSVLLDLGEVSYIDSSGIAVLLFGITESRRADKGFCISGVAGQVRRVIELTSLDGLLPITDTRPQAFEKLRA